jgi:hypothetical protein
MVQEVRGGKFGREAEAGYACSPFEVYCLSENRENGYPLKAGHRYTTMVSGL